MPDGVSTAVGSAHDDTLIGNAGANTLNGLGGDDTASYAGSDAVVTVRMCWMVARVLTRRPTPIPTRRWW